jgi:hypothetical protein
MPSNPLTDPNWAANLADTIERNVATIRNKTTRPLLLAYRGVIFGIVAVFGAAIALILLLIALIRALQALLDLAFDHATAVWLSYLLVGVVFTIVGLIVMKKRFPVDEALEQTL